MKAVSREGTAKVEAFHWNPRRPVLPGRAGRLLPVRRALNNFGDLLGPVVVGELLRRRGIDARAALRPARLLSVGSVLHLAQEGDVVWGTGVNGKALQLTMPRRDLDVRAVRGPRTRDVLRSQGIDAPEVYGDPGLLVGELWSREVVARGFAPAPVAVVPNFRDLRHERRRPNVVNPRDDLWRVLGSIAASELVVGSSLHGIVVAESFGIPARLVVSRAEPLFKYDDYYRGTGREVFRVATSVEEAVELGGERPPCWTSAPLLAAFPYDLWALP